MFDNITLGQAFLTLLIIGGLCLIIVIYVAFKLDSLTRHVDRQHEMSELKTQIVSELKKTSNTKD